MRTLIQCFKPKHPNKGPNVIIIKAYLISYRVAGNSVVKYISSKHAYHSDHVDTGADANVVSDS